MTPSRIGSFGVGLLVGALTLSIATATFALCASVPRTRARAMSTQKAVSARDGVFSTAQVERGRVAYNAQCARCHGETLGGGENSPALVDEG